MPTSRVSRGEGVTGRYEGPWSFLCETIWSLTSPNSKRISGPKKFRSSAKKDPFNTICHKQTFGSMSYRSDLEISRELAPIRCELGQDLLMKPNVHGRRIVCVTSVMKFFCKLLART